MLTVELQASVSVSTLELEHVDRHALGRSELLSNPLQRINDGRIRKQAPFPVLIPRTLARQPRYIQFNLEMPADFFMVSQMMG